MGDRRIVTSIVGAIAIGMLIVPNVAGAAATKQDVRVVNTASEAVPITGSVSITGTPAVSLSGTPIVQVGNNAGSPVPVAVTNSETLSSPFQFHAQFGFGEVAGGQRSDSVSFQVPEDKRLKIEFVTFSDLSRPVGVERVQLQVQTGDSFHVSHWLAVTTNGDTDSISQQTTLYADPGSTVLMIVTLTEPLGDESSTLFMHGSVVGTLTDA